MIRLLGLVALLLLAVPAPALADKADDQAARQLEFADRELNAGEFDRAIKSAESALRLDPTLYSAIVIKALAYEALEELDKAEALLVAYLEFTRGIQPDPRVGEALTRIRDRRGRRRAARSSKGEDAPGLEAHARVVREHITAGRCDEALVPARDFAVEHPREHRAHALLGDVQRCAQRLRRAALAYRKAVDLGAGLEVKAQLAQVEALLATLVVKLRAPTSAVAEVVVLLGDLEVVPTSFDRGVARFELLPAEQRVTVEIGGRGFQPQSVVVPRMAAAEVRRIEVSPTWLGVGTVVVGRWGAGIDTVEVIEGREATLVRPGEKLQVGAGAVTARIRNGAGMVELPLSVPRSREVSLEPARWIPVGLIVSGLPTGSTVEIQLGRAGEDLLVTHAVPSGGGALDTQTGALLAPDQTILGLAAGATTLRVKHPTLGVGAQAISLAPGQLNQVVFDQAQMPGTAALQARWTEHGTRPAKAKVNVPALGAGIGGGVALVLGGVFAALSVDSSSQQQAMYDNYVLSSGTGADATELFNQYQLQRRVTQDRTTVAGIFGGIGVIGVGVAIPLGLLVKPKARAPESGWEPAGF